MEPTLCMSYVLYSDEHVEPSFLWGRYFLSSTHFTDVESSLRGSVAYEETELGGEHKQSGSKAYTLDPRATLSPNHVAETEPCLIAPLEAEAPEKQPHD